MGYKINRIKFVVLDLFYKYDIKKIFIVYGILLFLVSTLFMANFWYDDEKVFRELQGECPQVVKLLKTETAVWGYSLLTVEVDNGKQVKYYLDTDIFYNYEFLKFLNKENVNKDKYFKINQDKKKSIKVVGSAEKK